MPDKAFIITDMLNDFIDPQGTLYLGPTGEDIIAPVKNRIEEMRRQGALIIFICDAHAEDDLEFNMFPAHAIKGQWGAEVIPALAPQPGDQIVFKTRYSSFFGTNLEQVLLREGVKEAYLAGVCTSICIIETVSDLRQRDYPTYVFADAVADFDPAAHDYSLKRMETIYGAKLI
ncbi:MAG: cysteine hydrolase [Deltaproteobacteria bacterium]|nr:cysteine hydrolase [Deltaproteobacteria bacterium]MBF0524898.1 cysteine hydrolase [Deltaproteobacteria bacterium]